MNVLFWLIVVFTVFGLSSEFHNVEECGKKIGDERRSRGRHVIPNSWPWFAALITKPEHPGENGHYFCGGTLISLKSVLTAAHCVQDKWSGRRTNPSEFEIHLGRHDLSNLEELKDNARILGPIIAIEIHPDWKPRDVRFDADIALLIAGEEFEDSAFILPVCLPDHDTPPNDKGLFVGWGLSSEKKTVAEDLLQKTQVEWVPQDKCFVKDGHEELAAIASERTVCVKVIAEGGLLCRGDSGGGFYAKSGDSWYIYGIASSGLFSHQMCSLLKHTIFTDLSFFKNWITTQSYNLFPVQFTYSVVQGLSEHHELKITRILRKGAFLSMDGHSVDSQVVHLACRDQDWRYLPYNIGFLFRNLKQFEATNLKIPSIDQNCFNDMSKLEILRLRDNLIEQIPSSCFDDLKLLVEINMANNRLKTIHVDTFVDNKYLKTIDLTGNQIQATELENLKKPATNTVVIISNPFSSTRLAIFNVQF